MNKWRETKAADEVDLKCVKYIIGFVLTSTKVELGAKVELEFNTGLLYFER